ncbi:MAG TPA: hypothetical protein PLC42_00365 [Parachlamydiaceae bacterium]|nr:hypothetical protein [Parachlamydiaceae bacterium]
MKKFIQLSAIFFGLLMTQSAFSQNYDDQSNSTNLNGCCPTEAASSDCPCGEQWTLMCHQQPCYYNDWKCVEEKVPCKRQCTRYVPKYYEVSRCRYVPQHYSETYCRYEKECYEVEDCRTCKKWVCEQKCKYVPRYYWKHTCGDSQVAKPASCQ